MATTAQSVADLCLAARGAARELATTSSVIRERALEAIADALVARTDDILEANARDMDAGRDALQRRLQAFTTPRDDEVDDALLGRKLGELLAPAAGDQ